MVSDNPRVERRIRESAILDEHETWEDGDGMVREQPSVADALLHSHCARGSVVVDSPIVGRASREVTRTCEEYDVPIEPTDVTVVAVRNHSANASATAYGCGKFAANRDNAESIQQWEVETEPDGYAILMATERWGTISFEEIVRHELAHICGWATEKVTYEKQWNHAAWCDRLDTR